TARQAGDGAKTLMRRVRRRTGNGRARENVRVRSSKVRMVQYVERFGPELNLMTFVVGHHEGFVYFSVEGINSRSDRCVSPDIAELSRRGFNESGTVVPAPWVGVGDARADARCNRPVVSGLSQGVVYAADGDGLRYPALQRQDPADLPAAE